MLKRILSHREKAAIFSFGLIALISLIFVLLAPVIPDTKTGQASLELIPLCLGPVAGSIGSVAMIWLRRRGRPITLLAIAGWFIGTALLGFGGFAIFVPGDRTFLANLGFSFALCFAPGGLLALLGLGAFWYANWRQSGGAAPEPERVERQTTTADPMAGLVAEAGAYCQKISALVREKRRTAFADHLADIPASLGRWEGQVRRLAARLQAYAADPLIQRDLARVPAAIAQLEQELSRETDPDLRAQGAETLAGYRGQQAQLEQLAALMRRTRLQLDETLAQMGTLYSQLQVLDALDLDNAASGHLARDVEEQIARLNDLLAATAEAYGDDQAGSGPGEGEGHAGQKPGARTGAQAA